MLYIYGQKSNKYLLMCKGEITMTNQNQKDCERYPNIPEEIQNTPEFQFNDDIKTKKSAIPHPITGKSFKTPKFEYPDDHYNCSYTPGYPMTFDEFLMLRDQSKIDYIESMHNRYGLVNTTVFENMFRCSYTNVSNELGRLGITPVKHTRNVRAANEITAIQTKIDSGEFPRNLKVKFDSPIDFDTMMASIDSRRRLVTRMKQYPDYAKSVISQLCLKYHKALGDPDLGLLMDLKHVAVSKYLRKIDIDMSNLRDRTLFGTSSIGCQVRKRFANEFGIEKEFDFTPKDVLDALDAGVTIDGVIDFIEAKKKMSESLPEKIEVSLADLEEAAKNIFPAATREDITTDDLAEAMETTIPEEEEKPTMAAKEEVYKSNFNVKFNNLDFIIDAADIAEAVERFGLTGRIRVWIGPANDVPSMQDFWRGVCHHRNLDGSSAMKEESDSGDCVCAICGARFSKPIH